MDREEIPLMGPNIELERPQPQLEPEGEIGVQFDSAKKEINPLPYDRELNNKLEVITIFIDGRKEGVQLVVAEEPTRDSEGEFVVLSASYVERSDEEVLLDDNPPQHRTYITASAVDVLGLMGQILLEKKKEQKINPKVDLYASKKDQIASIISSLPLVCFLSGWPQQLAINVTQHLSSVITDLIEKCKTELGVEVVPGKLDETIDKITALDDKLVEQFAYEFSRDVRHPALKLNDMHLDESMNVAVSSLEKEKDSSELIPSNNEFNTGDIILDEQSLKSSIPEESVLNESLLNSSEISGNINLSTINEGQTPTQDNLEIPSDVNKESNYITPYDSLVTPTQVTQEEVDIEKQTLGPVMDQFSKTENAPGDYKQSSVGQDAMMNFGNNLDVDSSEAFVQPNSTVDPSQVSDVINSSYVKPNDTPQFGNTPTVVSSDDKNTNFNIHEYEEKLGIWNNDNINFDDKVADSDLNKNLPIK